MKITCICASSNRFFWTILKIYKCGIQCTQNYFKYFIQGIIIVQLNGTEEKNGPCSYTFISYSRSCTIFNLVSQQKPAQVIPLTYIPYSICFYIALGLHFLTKMYGINNLLFCCARHEFGNRSTDVSRLINLWP